jgi:hypothetical protein
MDRGVKDARRLAVSGGRPALESPLHAGRPNLGDRGRFFAYLVGYSGEPKRVCALRSVADRGGDIRWYPQILEESGIPFTSANLDVSELLHLSLVNNVL